MNAQTAFDRECHAERIAEVQQRMIRIGREITMSHDFPECLFIDRTRCANLTRRLGVLNLGLAYLGMDAKVYREHPQGPRTTIATFFPDLNAIMAGGLMGRPVDLPTDPTCDKVNQQEEEYLNNNQTR